MATDPKPHLSPEDYLRIERAANFKSEYQDGQMFAMAGGSDPHSTISVNVTTELTVQLRGTTCRTFNSGMRLHNPATGLYTYTDGVAVCGEAEFLDGDNLLNPVLIVEVLSPSTQSYDRGDKFVNYRSIPTLREYLILAQDRPLVEQWELRDGHWTLTEWRGGIVRLSAMKAELPFTEIYRNVKLS